MTPLPSAGPGLFADLGRCRVMGVVNVTTDSFSDGGRWFDTSAAVAHGVALREQGADLVDVGGESTRPGAERIEVEEERRRVVPVVEALVREGVTVSVDTMRAAVAAEALQAGAVLVNDVSGGRADPGMLDLVARAQVPVVLMHWRGHSASMQRLAEYDDVLAEVREEIAAQVGVAIDRGVRSDRIVVDPGLGFAKTADQNWTVLAGLPELMELGHPVLVAASRKRFLGELLAAGGELRPTGEREAATVAVSTLAARAGAWAVRVHEPAATADAVRVMARWEAG